MLNRLKLLAFLLVATAMIALGSIGLDLIPAPSGEAPAQVQAQDGEADDNGTSGDDLLGEATRILSRLREKHERVWTYCFELRSLAMGDDEKEAQLMSIASTMMDDEDAYVRLVGAQITLALDGDDYEIAYEVLEEFLEDEEDEVLLESTARLITMYPPEEAEDFGELTREILEDREEDLSASSRVALARADAYLSEDELGVDRLRSYLREDSRELNNRAALALSRLGYLNDVRGRVQALAKESGELAQRARLEVEIEGVKADTESFRERGTTRERSREPVVDAVARLLLNNYVDKTFEHNQEDLELNAENLVDNAGRAMAGSLDPFSTYMTREEFEKMEEAQSGNYVGIGAYVTKGEDDPAVKISQPIYGGPAYAAGLRSGDYVWAYQEARGGDVVALAGLEVEEVVTYLRGEPNTRVKLWVKRPCEDQLIELEIKRESVHSDTALEQIMPGNIGYLRLTRFGGQSDLDMSKSLRNLKRDGMEGLILDLRGNPGGQLGVVLNIADMFLPKGAGITKIHGIWGRYREASIYKAESPAVWGALSLVILIDGNSASGAELLSGTLQDNGKALVLGEKSYGKGIGQGFYPIRYRAGDRYVNSGRTLKCTIFKYDIMPSEVSIDRKDGIGGVSPDIEVHSPLLSSWELYKVMELRKSEMLDQWLCDHWNDHKEEFMRLADFDGYTPKTYPGFETLYQALNTPLSRESVRRELRAVIRTRAADARAASYLQNFQTDYQLQRAIIEVSKKMRIDPASLPEYEPFLKDHAE